MKSILDKLTLFAFALVVTFGLVGVSQADATYYPRNYMASLHYAGYDFGPIEQVLPVRGSGRVGIDSLVRLMNTYRDFNSDTQVNPEDDLEMVVPYKIGYPVTGTTKKYYVINSSYPNDQRPAVYFHRVPMSGGYECWEYWLYYADNDVTIDQHEHDWEFYFIYMLNGSPYSTRVSFHGAALWYDWDDWVNNYKIESTSHLKLSLEAGYHCFTPPYQAIEDGVRIKYDGYVTKRGGRLDYGDNIIFTPWVFSNDSNLSSVTTYTQAPQSYWGGDSWYGSSENMGSDIEPPWSRSEGYWDTPPSPNP
jgi:hypothetical protein